MTVTNITLLDIYADMSYFAYLQPDLPPNSTPGYIQIHEAIDYRLGFQARAFFNVLTDASLALAA